MRAFASALFEVPLKLSLILVLLEAPELSESGLAGPRDVIVGDHLELRVQRSLLLAQKAALEFVESHLHSLVLLDINLQLDMTQDLVRLDTFHF